MRGTHRNQVHSCNPLQMWSAHFRGIIGPSHHSALNQTATATISIVDRHAQRIYKPVWEEEPWSSFWRTSCVICKASQAQGNPA